MFEKKELAIISVKEFENLKKEVSKINLDKIIDMLTKQATYFCKKNYDVDFDIPIVINGRTTSTLGSFCYTPYGAPSRIELSRNLVIGALVEKDTDILFDILKHELVHYTLYVLGKDNKDGSVEFETELKKHNISSSGATNNKKILSTRRLGWYTFTPLYKCETCDKSYSINRAVSSRRYFHINCPSCKKTTRVVNTKKVKVEKKIYKLGGTVNE